MENRSSYNMSNLTHSDSKNMARTTTINLVIPVIVVGIFIVFGGIGNLMVLIAYRRRRKRTHTLFILSLAFADFTICIVTLPFEIYEMWNTFTFKSIYLCKIFRTFNYLFVFWSTFILILLSVDRYRRVCKPIKLQISRQVAVTLVLVTFLISVGFSWPQIFFQGIKSYTKDNTTVFQCSITENYASTIYTKIYYQMILVLSIVNILTIIVLYSFIGRKVYKHVTYRRRFIFTSSNVNNSDQKSSQGIEPSGITHVTINGQPSTTSSIGNRPLSQNKEGNSFKITKIALVIGIAFVTSYVPSVFLTLMEVCLGERYMENYSSYALGFLVLAERAYIINHVVNPFIYGFLDYSFRKKCKTFIRKCLFNRCNGRAD